MDTARTGLRRHPAPLLAAAAALGVLALSGCDSQVQTTVQVTGSDTAQVSVSATFDGEAAQVINEDAAVRKDLVDLFANRTGHKPTLKLAEKKVTASVDVEYNQVANLSGITGVGAIALTAGGSQTSIRVEPPRELVAQVRNQTRNEEDSAVLAQTILDTTEVAVAVTYPGGIKSATSTVKGAKVTRTGDTVTLTTSASSTSAGEFIVTGDTSQGTWWPWAAGGAAGLVTLLWWYRRPNGSSGPSR